MSASKDMGFHRTFGNVHHYLWIHSSLDLDIQLHAKQMVADSEAIVDAILPDRDPITGFSVFAPLLESAAEHSILWLERYADIRTWAQAEFAAQRSPQWMQRILASETNESVSFGESNVLVDDSTTESQPISCEALSIDWTITEPSKFDTLTKLPTLVAELEALINQEGFKHVRCRCLAMTTGPGKFQHLGHLWIESPDPTTLMDVLDWRQRSPALSDWRTRFKRMNRGEIKHHLLSRVG